MNCQETHTFISSYIDGELDVVRSMELEEHAKSCGTCSGQLQAHQALHGSMQSPAMRFHAPKRLVTKIQGELRKENAETGWRGVRWAQFGYALALLAVFAVSVGIWRTALNRDSLTDQVVANHVRSLMASHLYDVQSTDQHTVKPWFHGKLDYAPPVTDFAAQGYPLVGGRLDVLSGRSVAAIVYQRRQHPINLFVWPTQRADSRPRNLTSNGYNLIHWRSSGMEYWLVSDLNDNELRAFAQMLQSE